MTTLNFRTPLLALSLITVAACDAEEPEFGAGPVSDRCTGCGIKLNTNKIGDHVFSEIDTTGDKWDGVALESVTLKRFGKLEKVWAEAGQLMGHVNGQDHGGLQFKDAVFALAVELTPGNWVDAKMYVTDVSYDPLYGWKYRFSHEYIGGPKEPFPNCDEDTSLANGIAFDAIVTENITVDVKSGFIDKRENTLFIGCLSGGVGKAGFWGYPRHLLASLEQFTGAVRMVRADYCATGQSFTEVGQQLTMTDAYGQNGLVPNNKLEALWTERGAACVYIPRLTSEWPSATDVIKECENTGGNVPKECESDWDLNSLPDVLFQTANPT